MGLWIKNADGTIERTAGGGADGADGEDGQPGVDGEDGQPGADGNLWHVGSGEPDPTLGEPGDYYLDGTDGWVYVKRNDSSWTNLYVNLTGPPGDSGGGDFLPLTGGTLTGDGHTLALRNATPSGQPYMSFYHNGIRKGYIGNATATTTELSAETNQLLLGGAGVRVGTDLQVDGNADLKINVPADFWQVGATGTVFNAWGMVGSTQGSHALSMTSNGYRNKDNKWTSMGVNDHVGGVEVSLVPTGVFHVRVSANMPTGSASNPTIRFTVNESGPTFRAMPSKTRTVDDVLERAETAEFPPEDDEGVVTMDGHDEVPLFEVVSALLAKVKELSARIEALEK